MCASWKRGYNPDVVTTGLENIKSISENGEVSFTGFEFDDYATVLLSSLVINGRSFTKEFTVLRSQISLQCPHS